MIKGVIAGNFDAMHPGYIKMFNEMKQLNNNFGFTELSMGMSSDYFKAVKNSSTYVRIGSSIFGQRI